MKLTDNTILITGGATGIGFALAGEFIRLGNTVIICGRRENKLAEAKHKLPRLITRVCDVSVRKDREELMDWAFGNFPALNVLVNNAGIQREVRFNKGIYTHNDVAKEIETNLTAPIHLSALFISKLTAQPASAIVNVSSGLAFTPLAITPVYCSTKAALHSFTLSLRYQLSNTATEVYELIPPIVDTELDQGARDKRQLNDRGMKPREFALLAIEALGKGVKEAAIGMAADLRQKREELFNAINRQPVQ
ncbi:MAG: SDR family NAD(P)-dependent oxidoreductase [Bacteroidia bacterium]|nr:SDR family NAD(P)-dependent oxidoreductase [Bacteroidia bacterium]